jgi:hypothetical protein
VKRGGAGDCDRSRLFSSAGGCRWSPLTRAWRSGRGSDCAITPAGFRRSSREPPLDLSVRVEYTDEGSGVLGDTERYPFLPVAVM